MSEEIKNIIKNGFDLISAEAQKCGGIFVIVEDDSDGVLDDDAELLSFTVSGRFASFNTDDGIVEPGPVMFELTYDRFNEEYTMTFGEDTENSITSGNVMGYMYFNSLSVAGKQ